MAWWNNKTEAVGTSTEWNPTNLEAFEKIHGEESQPIGAGNILYGDGGMYWGHEDPANDMFGNWYYRDQPKYGYNVPNTNEDKMRVLKETDPDGYSDYVRDPLSRGLAGMHPTTWVARGAQALGIIPEWNETSAMNSYIKRRDDEELKREAYERAMNYSTWSGAPKPTSKHSVRVAPLAVPNRYRYSK